MKKDMTQGSEFRVILIFAIPIMLANLLQQAYNAADAIIVGRYAGRLLSQTDEIAGGLLAQNSLGAVGAVAPLTFLFLAFAMGLGVGVSVVCAQLYGARQEHKLAAAFDTSILLMSGFGIVVTVAGWVLSPWLLHSVLSIEKSDPIYGLSLIYLQVYCLGLPFQFAYNAIASALRGVGDSAASLIFLAVTCSLNVVLDLWLVISFDWGVMGAAVATVISQVICVALAYWYLRRKFPLVRGGQHFDLALCKTTVKIGLPTSIQQSIVALGNVALTRLAIHFTTPDLPVITAFAAGSKVDLFMFVPISGLQSALASFTGQNLAANRPDRVKRAYYRTAAAGLGISIALCILLYVFARPIIALFGVSGAAVTIGVEQVQYYAKVFWIFAIYMILGGVLQGAGDTLLQSAATLSALVTRVAVAYLGAFVFGWFGYEAAWVTLAVAWVVALIITNVRYYTGGWKKKVVAHRAETPEITGEL
ncbi:MAG: MATE family efflux transporter [Oscillospiraceae bacterium]|jgi:putative MATE family efflux protein|nr:MATE family efflux transporter [Oscillospiraceae bacterium]